MHKRPKLTILSARYFTDNKREIVYSSNHF